MVLGTTLVEGSSSLVIWTQQWPPWTSIQATDIAHVCATYPDAEKIMQLTFCNIQYPSCSFRLLRPEAWCEKVVRENLLLPGVEPRKSTFECSLRIWAFGSSGHQVTKSVLSPKDAVVQCGTNLSFVNLAERLEHEVGIPIIAINAAWHARLAVSGATCERSDRHAIPKSQLMYGLIVEFVNCGNHRIGRTELECAWLLGCDLSRLLVCGLRCERLDLRNVEKVG